MRSYDENEPDDVETLAWLQPEPWMLEALKLNAGYLSWELEKAFKVESLEELPELDDYNECAAFFFDIHRDIAPCKTCNVDGRHMASCSKEVRRIWHTLRNEELTVLTDEDVLAMSAHWRGYDMPVPSATEINAFNDNIPPGTPYSHPWRIDMLNEYHIARGRATRQGLPLICPDCSGRGDVFTEPKCRLQLHLWWLYPRKGQSGEAIVENIEEDDLIFALDWLITAADRNAQKFSGILDCSPRGDLK